MLFLPRKQTGSLKNEPLEISIGSIIPNPDQPRKSFNDDTLLELSASIKAYGVLQPILVQQLSPDAYSLIAGERRYRAAIIAGCEKIPVIVKSLDEKDTAIIALTENLQRENLSFFEEAAAYSRLIHSYHLTQNDICSLVGKKQSTISNKLRLLALSSEVKELLVKHRLTERHARALLSLQNDQQRISAIQSIVSKGLNISQTEKLIEQMLKENSSKSTYTKLINYKIYVNTLKKSFQTIKALSAEAEYKQEDKGDSVEIRITIPKKCNELHT